MSIDGLWHLSVETPSGEFKGTLELAGEGEVSVRMANTLGAIDCTGTLRSGRLEFSYVYPEEMGRLAGMLGTFSGAVTGDEIAGEMFLNGEPFAPWTAIRA